MARAASRVALCIMAKAPVAGQVKTRLCPSLDLVLGPSDDGGYYLIGLQRLRPELFEGMPWSTGAVFGVTLRRAGAPGLRTVQLASWYDVNTAVDLERPAAELAGGTGRGTRQTRKFVLDRLAGRTAKAQEGV